MGPQGSSVPRNLHNRELPSTDISNMQEHDYNMTLEARKLVPFPKNPAVSNYLSINSGNGCTFQFQRNLIVLLERDNQYFVPCNEEVKQNGYNYFGENRGMTLEEHFIFGFVLFDSLRPINNLSVIKGRVFLG